MLVVGAWHTSTIRQGYMGGEGLSRTTLGRASRGDQRTFSDYQADFPRGWSGVGPRIALQLGLPPDPSREEEYFHAETKNSPKSWTNNMAKSQPGWGWPQSVWP